MTQIEKRTASEVRVAGRKLTGYAATFGTEARIADFSETIAPGAFAASLASGNDILALVDHDRTKVLGRTSSGSLSLSEDARGLKFEITLPNTSAANDVLALAEARSLGGMSFGFSVDKEDWSGEKRTLQSVTLHEVKVVSAWPAYDGTTVSARARQTRTAAQRRIALLELESK
jgi:uncharacterized protein